MRSLGKMLIDLQKLGYGNSSIQPDGDLVTGGAFSFFSGFAVGGFEASS